MENLQQEPAIKEYNPELRVEEDKEGIQFALNMLSFKVGLGTKYYEFNGSSVVTATQYVGDRQDLIVNANKHRKKVDEFVSGICKAILLLGRILFKEAVTEECLVKVTDKDGFMVDTETSKQEFRQDIAQGIRQAWEYRVKFFGEDEETAKAMVKDEEIEDIDDKFHTIKVKGKKHPMKKNRIWSWYDIFVPSEDRTIFVVYSMKKKDLNRKGGF